MQYTTAVLNANNTIQQSNYTFLLAPRVARGFDEINKWWSLEDQGYYKNNHEVFGPRLRLCVSVSFALGL